MGFSSHFNPAMFLTGLVERREPLELLFRRSDTVEGGLLEAARSENDEREGGRASRIDSVGIVGRLDDAAPSSRSAPTSSIFGFLGEDGPRTVEGEGVAISSRRRFFRLCRFHFGAVIADLRKPALNFHGPFEHGRGTRSAW